jgi:uncharacterized protein (TIGR02246 family)
MRPSSVHCQNQDQGKRASRSTPRRCPGWVAAGVLAIAVMLAGTVPLSAGSASAQKQKKSKDSEAGTGIVSPFPLPDAEAIDLLVSRMLGAWQVGDVALMHKCYADDVVVVSAVWEPPLIGWDRYLRAYQAERAEIQGGRLDRTNSYTKVLGNTAWVTYQWRFTGHEGGQTLVSYGHTTLVLQKHAGNWLIVLNHTSAAAPPARKSSTPFAPTTTRPVNPRPPGPGR